MNRTIHYVKLIDPVYANRSRGLNTYPVTRVIIEFEQNGEVRRGLLQVEDHIPELLESSFYCPLQIHPEVPICVAFPLKRVIVQLFFS
jgi:hypothetical protein